MVTTKMIFFLENEGLVFLNDDLLKIIDMYIEKKTKSFVKKSYWLNEIEDDKEICIFNLFTKSLSVKVEGLSLESIRNGIGSKSAYIRAFIRTIEAFIDQKLYDSNDFKEFLLALIDMLKHIYDSYEKIGSIMSDSYFF